MEMTLRLTLSVSVLLVTTCSSAVHHLYKKGVGSLTNHSVYCTGSRQGASSPDACAAAAAVGTGDQARRLFAHNAVKGACVTCSLCAADGGSLYEAHLGDVFWGKCRAAVTDMTDS